VESFGGRVTSAVSGKTDVLLVGKEPGMSKAGRCAHRVDRESAPMSTPETGS
jgi:BRCT domain type II-containing protein